MFIKIDDLNIYYEVEGKAPDFVYYMDGGKVLLHLSQYLII